MAKESAVKFVQAVMDNEELREKTANMKPEEAIPFAKEMGYDFTAEELTEVMNEDKELSPDELENAAGGNQYTTKLEAPEDIYCYGNVDGPKHNFSEAWVARDYFIFWKREYYIRKCYNCKYVIEEFKRYL